MGAIIDILLPNNTESDPKLNSDGISKEAVQNIVDEAGEIQIDDREGADELKQNQNLEVVDAHEEVQPFLPSNKWYRNKKFIFVLKHVVGMIYFCTIMYIMYYILDMAFGPKTWREKKMNDAHTVNS